MVHRYDVARSRREPGGFEHDDTNVVMLLSNPSSIAHQLEAVQQVVTRVVPAADV